jgi:hypothetical protein
MRRRNASRQPLRPPGTRKHNARCPIRRRTACPRMRRKSRRSERSIQGSNRPRNKPRNRRNNRRSRIVTRHRKSGNRSISGADSRRPTLAINRVSHSARSSRVRPRRRRPGFRRRGGRSIRWCAPPSTPQPRVSPPAGPSAPPAALPARPAVRQGAIRFRPCIRGVPQRACHPPALARRSRRASPRAICRIAVRRRKPVSQAGPDRPLADRYPWRRRSRPRRRSRGPPAARPPQRQQPGSRKGPVGLRSPLPCPRPAVRLPHIRKRANRSRWMRRPPWPHAVPVALSISAARAPMALAP